MTELKKAFKNKCNCASVNDTADAVGLHVLAEKHWYIAVVKHGNEKVCGRNLTDLGYENYVPLQRELRQYANGRKKWIERLVLPSRVFVRATEDDRLKNVATLPVVNRFMVDPSRRETLGARASAAIVPDKEMEMFRLMLEQDELPVTINETGVSYASGDHVRVAVGKLAGLEGIVMRTVDDKKRLYVSLDILGAASVEVDSSWLELIK